MTDFKVRWLNANSDTLGLLHCRHGNHSCVANVGRLGTPVMSRLAEFCGQLSIIEDEPDPAGIRVTSAIGALAGAHD
jgi:hypothetical protein